MASFEPIDLASLGDDSAFCGNMRLALRSAIEGNTRAGAWSSSESLVFWERANNTLYISGPLAEFESAFPVVFSESVRPSMMACGRRHFSVQCNGEGLHKLIPGLLARATFEEALVVFMEHGSELPPLDPSSFDVVPIDRELIGLAHPNAEAIAAEVGHMWPSVDDFLERGFGYASMMDDAPVSWCTAEFASTGLCGIGIETVEEFRSRGHATAVALAFVREARRRGIEPMWFTHLANERSIGVARKAGFVEAESSRVWDCSIPAQSKV